MIPPRNQRGMILINVLAMVAVAAAVVTLMQAAEAPAIDRATRFGEAARALAIARGGEASIVAALRADTTPDSDDATDGWALAAQSRTPIAGGSFTLTVADAQDRLNVNSASVPVLATIATALGLPRALAPRIAAIVAARGPLDRPGELTDAGVAPQVVAALRPYLTALPGDAPVNLNSASPTLLGFLLHDPDAAQRLAARRARSGRLTPDDFAATGIGQPDGTGFTSDHFIATATVTIGGTTQRLASLIERRVDHGRTRVAVLARSRDQPPAR